MSKIDPIPIIFREIRTIAKLKNKEKQEFYFSQTLIINLSKFSKKYIVVLFSTTTCIGQ